MPVLVRPVTESRLARCLTAGGTERSPARTIAVMQRSIERVFVAGAGLMGHGIAQVHAAIGKDVTLYEPDLAAPRPAGSGSPATSSAPSPRAATAEERARRSARITATVDLAAAADADLVDRGGLRGPRRQARAVARTRPVAPRHAIFATNTSSISIPRLAEAVARDRRTRFLGMHFFSPVPVMPLIELIRAPRHVGRDREARSASSRRSSASRSSCPPTGRGSSSTGS